MHVSARIPLLENLLATWLTPRELFAMSACSRPYYRDAYHFIRNVIESRLDALHQEIDQLEMEREGLTVSRTCFTLALTGFLQPSTT